MERSRRVGAGSHQAHVCGRQRRCCRSSALPALALLQRFADTAHRVTEQVGRRQRWPCGCEGGRRGGAGWVRGLQAKVQGFKRWRWVIAACGNGSQSRDAAHRNLSSPVSPLPAQWPSGTVSKLERQDRMWTLMEAAAFDDRHRPTHRSVCTAMSATAHECCVQLRGRRFRDLQVDAARAAAAAFSHHRRRPTPGCRRGVPRVSASFSARDGVSW